MWFAIANMVDFFFSGRLGEGNQPSKEKKDAQRMWRGIIVKNYTGNNFFLGLRVL